MKKIACIVICCLSLLQSMAQQQTVVNRLLDSITKSIHLIIRHKTVSDSCRRNIKQFEKSLAQRDIANWKKNNVDTMIQRVEKFVTDLQPKGKLKCNDKSIKNLVDVTQRFKAALNKLNISLAAVEKDLTEKKDTTINKTQAAKYHTDSDTGRVMINKAAYNSSEFKSIIQQQAQDSSLLTNRIEKLYKDKLTLTIERTILICLVTIISLLYFSRIKNHKKLIKAMSDQKDSNLDQPKVEETATKPELSEAVVQPDGIVQAEKPKEDSDLIASLPGANSYFLCEVMMTAGPRKKFMSEENADKDLGEDICGFISNSNQVLIWLLDGTSDLHCLKNPVTKHEYFSSRLLALNIAEKLKANFIDNPVKFIAEMVAQAIIGVKSTWLETIEQLPAEEKLILKSNIANKNFPECATTLLIAQLSINGDFTAYRSGDSKMLLFSVTQKELNFIETPLVQKNEESNDRIFFRLRLNEQDKFDIVYNEPLHEIIIQKNVNTIITFSDGVGMNTEQVLIEEYKAAPDKTRNEIIYHSQETGDDKSICFIEIKKSGNL